MFSLLLSHIKIHNWIISCKIDPISDNKLCEDDMKKFSYFVDFNLEVKYFKFTQFIKWMPRNFLCVFYTRENNGYYDLKENNLFLQNKIFFL